MNPFALNFFILLSVTSFCSAQSSDTLQSKLMEEIVVSASRTNQNILQSPNSISLIKNNSDVRFTIRTTPETLINTAGVFVQKTNHGGGSPILRGMMGNQTLLLIDGIRLNNSTFRYGPNQYFNNIDPFSINQIEVLRGSGSVQYGSDALGGAIHVLTADPVFDQNLKLKLIGRIASEGIEKTLNGKVSFGIKKIAILGSANFRNFGDLIGGKNTGLQTPSGYDEQSQNLKSKMMLGKGIIMISYQNYKASKIPIYHKIIKENYKTNQIEIQQRQLSFINYKLHFKNKNISKLELIASLQNTNEGRKLQKNNSDKITLEKDKVNTKGLTGNLTTSFFRTITGNSGVEIYHDLVKSQASEKIKEQETSKRGLYPDNSKYLNYSVYSLHQYQFNKFQFSGGLRYNRFKIWVQNEKNESTIIEPKALVGNASILSSINSLSSIYISYNSGFRAPNIDDLGTLGIVDFRYELPTFDLKPEKSKGVEIGYKLKNESINISTSLFYTKLNDLITRVKIPNQFIENYAVYQKQNIEKAFIKGFEVNLELFLLKNLKISSEVTHTFGQNITKKEPLRRIPPTFGRVDAQFNEKNYFFKSEFLFAAAQKRLAQADKDDNRIGIDGTSQWGVFNLSTGYHFKKIFFNFLVNNIFNTDYRIHASGINGMGRVFYLTTSLSI